MKSAGKREKEKKQRETETEKEMRQRILNNFFAIFIQHASESITLRSGIGPWAHIAVSAEIRLCATEARQSILQLNRVGLQKR